MIGISKGYHRRLAILCRGQTEELVVWLEEKSLHWPIYCCVGIVFGCGLYGATIGLWRSPFQSLYAGIKFPLLIFITLFANAGLNGMLAQLLGVGLSFRQTTLAILMSFTIVALILGAFTPISLFILWNTPSLSSNSMAGHYFIKLTHVVAIAYAGVMANLRLYRLLAQLSGSAERSRKTLLAWLIGNLFLGSQLSWIMRPFIGSPFLKVQFLRDDAFNGNFYENIFETIKPFFT